MDLMQLGSQLLSENLGVQIEPEKVGAALTGLLGDSQGNVDIAALAGKMTSSGELGNILSSWLGDGSNAPISADSIAGLLGNSKVEDCANKLGTDSSTAAAGLSEVIPQIMDKVSSGGSLLVSVGGLGGLMDAASSFLKK